jgi:hypothetical protein
MGLSGKARRKAAASLLWLVQVTLKDEDSWLHELMVLECPGRDCQINPVVSSNFAVAYNVRIPV